MSLTNSEKQEIFETLLWYFSVVDGTTKPSTASTKLNSKRLGKELHSLNDASVCLMYICSMNKLIPDNLDFTQDHENEFVGKGQLDPLFRLNNTNEACLHYLRILPSLYPELEVNPQGLKELSPFIYLLMYKYRELLSTHANLSLAYEDNKLLNDSNDYIRTLNPDARLIFYARTFQMITPVIIKSLTQAISDIQPNFFQRMLTFLCELFYKITNFISSLFNNQPSGVEARPS